jgi:glycosyltransferase involved in cell wall biosynthesis
MKHGDRSVLLLTRMLAGNEPGRDWKTLVGSLADRGVDCRFLSVGCETNGDHEMQVVECPGLGRIWQRAWSIRRLDPSIRRPLIHVLDASLSDVGLALAEHWFVPYVQTIEEFPPDDTVLRVSRRWCKMLLPTGDVLADDLSRTLNVPRALLRVIRPGVSRMEPARTPRLASTRVAVVGAAGPLVAASGFFTFLTAARRVLDTGADVEFVVIGQGEDEVDLRRRADRLRMSDRITFAGRPIQGLSPWDAMDVYCQTSTTPTTGFPLIRAMARGVPSIVADVQGPRSLVEDGHSGLIVPPEDSQALAQSMLSLIADPTWAAELGARGRDSIRETHDSAVEADRLIRVYDEALADDRPSCLAPIAGRLPA